MTFLAPTAQNIAQIMTIELTRPFLIHKSTIPILKVKESLKSSCTNSKIFIFPLFWKIFQYSKYPYGYEKMAQIFFKIYDMLCHKYLHGLVPLLLTKLTFVYIGS